MNALDMELYEYAMQLVKKRLQMIPLLLSTVKKYQNQYQNAKNNGQVSVSLRGNENKEKKKEEDPLTMCENLQSEQLTIASYNEAFGTFQPTGHKGPSISTVVVTPAVKSSSS
jgi:recombinational DNA repair ATPase RecF